MTKRSLCLKEKKITNFCTAATQLSSTQYVPIPINLY